MIRARTRGTFLAPLDEPNAVTLALINERTGTPLATVLEPALDRATRNRGLLGRDGLATGAAMIIAPCRSIHTFFMRFPIDVVFADRDGRILKISHALPAWRLSAAFLAYAAIELRAGAVAETETRQGDRLVLMPRV